MDIWRIILVGVSALFGAYLLIGFAIYCFPNRFTFLPKKMLKQETLTFEGEFEELFLESIHGVYFKATQPSKGLVLYFHGNRGNLQRWGNFAKDFTKFGYDFLAIDYPGYGKSIGKPSESALFKSSEIAYNWARQKYSANSIVIYGRSIGSVPASYLASHVKAKCLILETPFYNFQDLYEKHWILSFYPFSPKYPFRVDQYVQKVTYPVYIFHGTKDGVIPLESAIQLKPLLEKENNFIVFKGAKHNNISSFNAYHQHLEEILEPVDYE